MTLTGWPSATDFFISDILVKLRILGVHLCALPFSSREIMMKNEIFKLRKEHVDFRKLLELLDVQLGSLEKGKNPDYQVMTDILYYMTQYSDLIHHPTEEVIFALLTTRDPSVKDDVAELTKLHYTIGKSGACLYEKLGKIVIGETEIRPLKEIEIAGRLYVTTLRTHMDTEEQGLFVLAEQLLNEDDWNKIRAETQTKPDPIFGEAIEARFHMVCDQLAQLTSNK